MFTLPMDVLIVIVRNGFIKRIIRNLPAFNSTGQFHSHFRQRADNLQKLWKSENVDRPTYYHFSIASLVIAAYELLPAAMSEEAKISLLTEALSDTYRQLFRFFFKMAFEHSADPFSLIKKYSLSNRADSLIWGNYYGFERHADEVHIELKVTRCAYHYWFAQHNYSQLTPILCATDAVWIELLQNPKYGVIFHRPGTLGTGATCCIFSFDRHPKSE